VLRFKVFVKTAADGKISYVARTRSGNLALGGSATGTSTGWRIITASSWLAPGDIRLTVSWGACRVERMIQRPRIV
jgi:hypothetical protein